MMVQVKAVQLSGQEVREVFRKIAHGERKHGGFLTTFAQAYIAADPLNEAILCEAARELADKYNIAWYGKEPASDEASA